MHIEAGLPAINHKRRVKASKQSSLQLLDVLRWRKSGNLKKATRQRTLLPGIVPAPPPLIPSRKQPRKPSDPHIRPKFDLAIHNKILC